MFYCYFSNNKKTALSDSFSSHYFLMIFSEYISFLSVVILTI
jgi:hypothetical protein